MNSYETIKSALGKLFEEAGLPSTFSLDAPETVEHGDWATNAAFILSKAEKTSPQVCAENLIPKLTELLKDTVSKIEVAGPGFINFHLSKEAVRSDVKRLENLSSFVTAYTGKKVLVEHSSPNLFKPFSIGLLLNNIAGEAIIHLVKAGGASVTAISFPSDVSIGIAKAIYMVMKDGGFKQEVFAKSEEEVISYLGQAYAHGVAHFDEHESSQVEVKEVAQKLYSATPSEELDVYNACKKINISYFEHMLAELGSSFDGFIYESEAAVVGKEIVLTHASIFTKSEGAIVYIPEEGTKGVHTAVFINSQGNPTYEAKDLGLLKLKFENYTPDYSLFVTDNEQVSHFNVVLDAAAKIEKDWKEKSIHISHGRMTFKGQKMSARLGNTPLTKDILSTVMEEVESKSGDKIAHFTDEEKKTLYKEIALSALRFSMLRSKLGSNINFDPETSLSFEGDSGPYVQYTYARAMSLITKGKELGFTPEYDALQEVSTLERKLVQFETIAIRSIEELAPQYIVTYLFELSQMFNSFYASTPVIIEGDALTSHRLALTQSVASVIKKALAMLAVSAPEKM